MRAPAALRVASIVVTHLSTVHPLERRGVAIRQCQWMICLFQKRIVDASVPDVVAQGCDQSPHHLPGLKKAGRISGRVATLRQKVMHCLAHIGAVQGVVVGIVKVLVVGKQKKLGESAVYFDSCSC